MNAVILVVFSTFSLLVVKAPAAHAKSAWTCRSNADCACGWNESTATCEVGGPSLDPDKVECFELCHGFSGTLEPICQGSECVRSGRSPCPGDCDADITVTVDEILASVGVALGENPVAVCRALDSNGDGVVTIDEILRALVAVLNGCAAATSLPDAIKGFFDTVITFDGQNSVQALGTKSVVNDETSLSIDIGPNERLTLYVSAHTDGQLDLEGNGIFTDIGYTVQGTALRSEGPEGERIEGQVRTMQGFYAPFETATFVMQRAVTTAVDFGGTYRLELSSSPGKPDHSSSLLLALQVAPSGGAIMSGGRDTETGGAVVGTVTPGRCFIAAGGSLSCNAVYLVEGSDVSAPLRFTGRLGASADGVTGSGRYLAGVDPPYDIYVHGGWTALRGAQ